MTPTATEFLRKMFEEARRLRIAAEVWDLVSAMRGPDLPEDQYKKDTYTLPIRRALGVNYGGLPTNRPDDWKLIDQDKLCKLAFNAQGDHYLDHINIALLQLGVDQKTQERNDAGTTENQGQGQSNETGGQGSDKPAADAQGTAYYPNPLQRRRSGFIDAPTSDDQKINPAPGQ